jgi:arabinogalactan endo-1,4-beta-galactosidase
MAGRGASGNGRRPAAPKLYLGGDLSFTNEMEDCGAVFPRAARWSIPFVVMKAHGGNIMRVRIWNAPDWTKQHL